MMISLPGSAIRKCSLLYDSEGVMTGKCPSPRFIFILETKTYLLPLCFHLPEG